MSPSAFMIAPTAAEPDIAAIKALFRAYAASLPIDLGYQNFEAELAALPDPYAPPRGALLLARNVAGEPIGCAALRPLDGETGEMKRLYVAPHAQSLGLGRALAQAIIVAARQAGYRWLCLDTLPSMAGAQALYRSLGFVMTPAYYDTPIAGTVFLRKQLV